MDVALATSFDYLLRVMTVGVFKMAAIKILFWLYNNFFLCWLIAYNVHAVALTMYLGTWAIVGAKMERNDTCSFQEMEHL